MQAYEHGERIWLRETSEINAELCETSEEDTKWVAIVF